MGRNTRRAALLGAAFGAGLVLGGARLVRAFDWSTEWTVDAPLPLVYRTMTEVDEQKRWWPAMTVVRSTPIPGVPLGRAIDYLVHQSPAIARFMPPFRITATTADVQPERRLRSVVSGDLIGVLETLFEETAGGVRVRFHWYVRLRNPLLNALGFLLAPLYRASHDHVMLQGEVGLRRRCREQASVTAESS